MKLISNDAYAILTYSKTEDLEELATNFFYWWHNQPGSNTREGFAEWVKLQARCLECGARTPEEAQTMCICGGDKDFCHGGTLWPDVESQIGDGGRVDDDDPSDISA